eukprot:8828862-Heterocapsa_arctica.AAC.1
MDGGESEAIASRAANRCPQLVVSQGMDAGSGRRAAGCGHPAAQLQRRSPQRGPTEWMRPGLAELGAGRAT